MFVFNFETCENFTLSLPQAKTINTRLAISNTSVLLFRYSLLHRFFPKGGFLVGNSYGVMCAVFLIYIYYNIYIL